MTEFESPAALVSARATALARETRSRLDRAGKIERPRALGRGFGASDVGVPSLVAALVVEAASDGPSRQTASEAPSAAVRTGVAVEALDRHGQALATVLGGVEASGAGGDDVTDLMLWSDWLHARARQLLLEASDGAERSLSAMRTMGREVASRNERREHVDGDAGPVVATPSGAVDDGEVSVVGTPSGAVDDDEVSVVVRGGGCSCAATARIGGLIGDADSGTLERAVTYGGLVDDAVREYGQSTSRRSDEAGASEREDGPAAGVSSGAAGVVGSDLEGFGPAVSNSSSESVPWSALWWLLLAVDGDSADV
ncbi:hypothetical protein [Halorubellus sp. PRR65]|uniref:hypothetical protein n=1 Tax=Halorubellus sp. PRR65 TaxID=3098148 RepID=UPI002B2581C1|nr:hypothetical protein [Halorubellus sp. PRR65]